MKNILRSLCFNVSFMVVLMLCSAKVMAEDANNIKGQGGDWVDGPEELRGQLLKQQLDENKKEFKKDRPDKNTLDDMSSAADRAREMQRRAKPQIEIR